ncbi:MAG: hypothetical protein Q8N93_02845, partial [Bacillota bacterium]|nr:hypothetical protein [Bacillota bacterium]
AWCFMVLNVRILWGVYHSKRLPRFETKYKVCYVVPGGGYPPAIANAEFPPEIGDQVLLGRLEFKVIDVRTLVPPKGRFCYLQAVCVPVTETLKPFGTYQQNTPVDNEV